MTEVSASLERINRWIAIGSYVQAYRELLIGLEERPGDDALLAASSRLATILRSRGWDLGSNKVTEQSEQLYEVEAMLPLVIRLNGEGLYSKMSDH